MINKVCYDAQKNWVFFFFFFNGKGEIYMSFALGD